MGGDRNAISVAEARNMLAWWIEAGVDVPVQEEPRNWLKAPAPASEGAAAPAQAVAAAPDPSAGMPESFDLFREWLGSAALPLASVASRRILPRGAEAAPVMLLAEAPNADDAADGQPIGGAAWQLAERMLSAIKIPADAAYVASISCFHAPGSRLSKQDMEACAAIARRHVALARPRRLLLLGDGPALALLGKHVAEARGHVHRIEGIRTVATFHPRYLLNTPSAKALAWRDLLLLMEEDQ